MLIGIQGDPLFEVEMLGEKMVKSLLFKLVDKRSIERCFLRGLRYTNVSLTHSGVDTVCN